MNLNNMKEYEYSMVVDSLNKYIDYCENNNYELRDKIFQTRTIYRKNNNTIARITINKMGNKEQKYLDFKEDKLSVGPLIERRESGALEFEIIKDAESILNFLEYKKDITLIRNRLVYYKDDVTFELDEYIEPNNNFVVSVEGNKEKADIVWNIISKL